MSEVLCWLLQAYWLVLLAHVILSWVPRPPEPVMPAVRVVRGLVEPLAAPLRRVLPPLNLGGISLDLSILVLFFAVLIVRSAVCAAGF